MNYYVAIPFFAVLVNVVSTTYIFAQNRKDPVNEAYIILSMFFIGWMFFDIIHWSPINPDWILPLLRIQSFFWILVGFAFTHFTYTFFQKKKDIVYYGILTAAMAAVPMGLTSDFVIKGYKLETWGTAIVPGSFYVPMVLAIVASPVVYSLSFFLRQMISTDDHVLRNQCRLILFGTGAAAIFIFITLIALPHFFDFPALPQTHFSIMLHLLFIFTAIVKYKFLSIGIRDAAQDIFSSVRDGVVLLGNKNETIQINESARKILGLDEDDDSQEVIDDFLGSNKDEKNIDEYETVFDIKGITKSLRVSRSPLKQSGKIVGSILFIRDVTSQKHAEYEVNRINSDLSKARDQALAASKAKSQFLANMSHELRTPLNAIIGYSEILKEEASDSNNRMLMSDLGKIHGAGHHLLTLINDILDLSKIEAGKMDIYVEEFSVSTLVNEVVEVIEPLIKKNSNKLLVTGLEDAGNIVTDITKLRQALYNLLSNASKFTNNGEVRLEIDRTGKGDKEEIVFRVADSGIGMSKEQVDGLFEYFSQADPSTTRKYGGTGLGLAISRRFCELLGGSISASSTEGMGSIFEIRLPTVFSETSTSVSDSLSQELEKEKNISRSNENSSSHSRMGNKRNGIRRVLVIDDDPAIREILQRHLEKEGFEVAEASNGKEGIYKAETDPPDMIILDVMMPDTDGWTVLEYLKSRPELSVVPVIMLTMVDDKTKGYALGALNFFSKPLDWPRLLEVINGTVGTNVLSESPVMVIDDDADNREMIKHSLEKEGFKVCQADNGKVAMDKIHENKPALILLDLMMPEMDGFEFVDTIRQYPEFRGIPIIVLTAMDLDRASRDRLSGQVQNILIKGAYRKEKLLSQITEIIVSQDREPVDSQSSS